MTDPKPSDLNRATDKANQLWGDFIPIILFVGIYIVGRRFPEDQALFNPETSLYWATGALILATFVIVGHKLIKKQPVPPFMIVTSAIIGGFGTLGIILQDKSFIFHKPTFQNLFLAGIIFGGFLFGRNIWKDMLQSMFELPDFAWRTLAIRWGLFFVGMALWNEALLYFFSEDVWAYWKLGNMFIVLAFGIANTPYMLKHLQDDPAPETNG